MNRIPWWAVGSATAAVVLLGVGLTLAQSRQPSGYDPIRDTISKLAAYGAADRWVMTSALAGLGVCHVITALGLRPARTSGRLVLGSVADLHGGERGLAERAAVGAEALWPLIVVVTARWAFTPSGD